MGRLIVLSLLGLVVNSNRYCPSGYKLSGGDVHLDLSNDYNYYNNEFRFDFVEECAAKCSARERCEAFEFGNEGSCYLKDTGFYTASDV